MGYRAATLTSIGRVWRRLEVSTSTPCCRCRRRTGQACSNCPPARPRRCRMHQCIPRCGSGTRHVPFGQLPISHLLHPERQLPEPCRSLRGGGAEHSSKRAAIGAAAALFSALFTALSNPGHSVSPAASRMRLSSSTIDPDSESDPPPNRVRPLRRMRHPRNSLTQSAGPAGERQSSPARRGDSVRGTGPCGHDNRPQPRVAEHLTGTPNLAQVSQTASTIVPTPKLAPTTAIRRRLCSRARAIVPARCADTLTWSSWGPSLIGLYRHHNLVVLDADPLPHDRRGQPSFEIGSAAVAAISAPCDLRCAKSGFAPPGPTP